MRGGGRRGGGLDCRGRLATYQKEAFEEELEFSEYYLGLLETTMMKAWMKKAWMKEDWMKKACKGS